MNAKKVLNIFSSLVTTILFLLLIFMVFVVISSKASGGEPQFLGYQLKTVLSGSMEPTFKTGSIIAVKPVEDPTALKKGDVITYMQQDGNLVTHRVTDVIKQTDQVMYQTKGDNNEDFDSQLVLSQNVVAKYTDVTIPYFGYFIDFAKSSKGIAIMLILPGILLLGYSGITIWSALKEIDAKTSNSEEKTA
ncbi:signal peptidase I [Mesobacillus subterraneus]|uniref:signal peptidase I SipW n=1 Tax=Mesobacillus subterraneus TaxID=285983 RepID=UPI00273DA9CE|nr:signal peptidase I [Mesobacillus subterraneus]WLR54369.1 signal peptidase I [Mesobacillus subterraneus]